MKPNPTMEASRGPTKINETTGSPPKSTEQVQTPTIKHPTKTVKPTEKAKVNHTMSMPSKKSLNKETVIFSDKVTTVTQNPSTRPMNRNESNWKNTNNGVVNVQGNQSARSGSRNSAVSGVGVGLIVLSLVIILAALCWFVYAYHHPQSRSGRFLIEVRKGSV
jgi:cobalamin biosynthesis Mg chelatase CobN